MSHEYFFLKKIKNNVPVKKTCVDNFQLENKSSQLDAKKKSMVRALLQDRKKKIF